MKKIFVILLIGFVIAVSINLYGQAERKKEVEILKSEAIEFINNEDYKEAVVSLKKAIEIQGVGESKELEELRNSAQEIIDRKTAIANSKKAFDSALASIENGNLQLALNSLRRVSQLDEENYEEAQLKSEEIKKILEKEYLGEAKKLYGQKEYIAAYASLEKVFKYNADSEDAKALIEKYEQKKNNQIAEIEAEKEKEKMESYESGYGPISIAASAKFTNTFSTGYSNYTSDGEHWYVWLYVNAKNKGTEISHVNPNYFTLSTSKGYTRNIDKITYSKSNYFDAIDLRPNTYSSGWMIFYIAKSDYYTLSYDSLDSFVEKKIVY